MEKKLFTNLTPSEEAALSGGKNDKEPKSPKTEIVIIGSAGAGGGAASVGGGDTTGGSGILIQIKPHNK
jgi:hypothetical protein